MAPTGRGDLFDASSAQARIFQISLTPVLVNYPTSAEQPQAGRDIVCSLFQQPPN
jgi:hypothetical protein